ncbi:MAG: hypothetical protein ACE5HJ_00045 [Thermoplasmata archaeon]
MMQLTGSELDVIYHVIDGQHRLASLSRASGLSIPRVSQLATKLERKGVLEKRREGLSVHLALTESTLGGALNRLFRLGQVDPKAVLHDSRLRILVLLASKTLDMEKLALETGLSRETVRKYLREFERLGVVKRDEDCYSLSTALPHLAAFLDEWGKHANVKKLREIAPTGTIRWQSGNEFIFATPLDTEPHEGLPTALTAMYDYGIELIVGEKHYHYMPWREELKPEDIALDTILAYPNSSRMLAVALVFLKMFKQIDRDFLLQRASEVGFREVAANTLRFIDGKSVPDPRFPTHGEFEQLSALFGVST